MVAQSLLQQSQILPAELCSNMHPKKVHSALLFCPQCSTLVLMDMESNPIKWRYFGLLNYFREGVKARKASLKKCDFVLWCLVLKIHHASETLLLLKVLHGVRCQFFCLYVRC